MIVEAWQVQNLMEDVDRLDTQESCSFLVRQETTFFR